jgi:hypothetical protein
MNDLKHLQAHDILHISILYQLICLRIFDLGFVGLAEDS